MGTILIPFTVCPQPSISIPQSWTLPPTHVSFRLQILCKKLGMCDSHLLDDKTEAPESQHLGHSYGGSDKAELGT